jgi:pyruvate formate lyase activating enzyme
VVSALSANPIEKKPLYHFYPGSRALTAGGPGCNLACPWCQNWGLSRAAPDEAARATAPQELVTAAIAHGCRGTSISFNEPTLSFEWSVEVFRLARANGLYNTFVSNGLMTDDALEQLAAAGLDALNVDLKGDQHAYDLCGGGVEGEAVWDRCRQARRLDLHLELTTLVVPAVNDSDACLGGVARRIACELGAESPWHLSRYAPAHRFTAPPTPVATLDRAVALGRAAGLSHVYVGNVPGHPAADTRCPDCDAVLVRRRGFSVLSNVVGDGACPQCGRPIAGVGWNWARETPS